MKTIIGKNEKHIKSYEIFLCISLIVSPLRCYGFVVFGFNFSLFRIFGLAMILCYVISKGIIIDNNTKILLLIIGITFVQSLYSPYLSGAYSNFFSLFFGFIWSLFAYQIIIRSNWLKVNTSKFVLFSAIFPLGLGLYQWIVYRATGSIPSLPFPFLVSSEGKTGLTYNVYARITSCFGDPAYMTTFYVGVFAIALQYLLSNNKKTNIILKIVSIIVVALTVVETVMSISLSGIIGLFASLVLTFLFNVNSSKYFRRLMAFIVVFGVGFIIFFSNSGSDLIEILIFKSESNVQSSTTLFGRSEYIINALNVWLSHPLIGAGFGALRLNGSFSSAHSSLLTVLGQQGIFVLCLNLAVLIFIPFNNYRRLKKAKNNYVLSQFLGVFIALLSIIVLTVGYDTLYSLDFCYVIIAFALSFSKNNEVTYG